MSDNLKDDVKKAVPLNCDNKQIKEPNFKEPQFLMHCLVESNSARIEPKKETDTNSDEE